MLICNLHYFNVFFFLLFLLLFFFCNYTFAQDKQNTKIHIIRKGISFTTWFLFYFFNFVDEMALCILDLAVEQWSVAVWYKFDFIFFLRLLKYRAVLLYIFSLTSFSLFSCETGTLICLLLLLPALLSCMEIHKSRSTFLY